MIYAIDWEPQESKHDVPSVQLWYPRNEGSAKEIEIELSDVRAADSLRVSYDFDRDGWVIKQASVFEWDADDEVCDEGWTEVAFVQAWALQKPDVNPDVKEQGKCTSAETAGTAGKPEIS